MLASALVIGAALVVPPTALAAPGDLDTTFSGDGLATLQFGGEGASVNGVAIDSQGRIVAAGYAPHTSTRGDIALGRMLPDGSPDPSFSGDGKLRTGWPFRDYATAVTIDSQGRIVVASYNLVARFLPNGHPDPSFSGDGQVKVVDGERSYLEDLAIDGQGRIVVAGTAGGDLGVTRLDPNGTLDRSFGSGGRTTIDFGGFEYGHSVAIDSRQRIVVGGDSSQTGRFAIARLRPNGGLDPAFSGDGRQTTLIGSDDHVGSIAIDDRDRVVVAGDAEFGGVQKYFTVVRYRNDGSLDPSFSQDGEVVTKALGAGGYGPVRGVAIDPEGRIVVGGYSTTDSSGSSSFALARYTPSGALDGSFGHSGLVETSFENSNVLDAVTIDPQGRIVGGGFVYDSYPRVEFAVVRYLGGP